MKFNGLIGDAQYYTALAARAREQYDHTYATGYRDCDDRGIGAPTHTDQGDLLTEVSQSFERPIDVLDLGCGTGRYFHCLKNLKSLTGVDVSLDMLRLAQHPVRESHITVPVTLLCANIAEVHFIDEAFDLIYSIGVLGRFLPLDGYMLEKAARMLKRGGKFVVTAGDKHSPQTSSWKRKAAAAIIPVLPVRLRRKVAVRLRDLRLTENELRSLMDRSPFSTCTIKRRYLDKDQIEFVCLANKD